MTLDQLRPLANRALAPFVDAAVSLDLTPDRVSLLAFLVAVGAGGAYWVAGTDPTLYLLGAVLVLVNGWLDLLDGALARRLEVESAAGDLLDHVLDRYADIVIVAGLAAGVGRWDVGVLAVTGVLMTSYLGTQAEAVGLDRVYGGVVGRADRLAIFAIASVVGAVVRTTAMGLDVVGWTLVLVGILGHLTAFQRFWHARRGLGPSAGEE